MSDGEEPPPFWGSWTKIYLFVAGLLLAQAFLYFALSRWAS
jgi:hypothetical protein